MSDVFSGHLALRIADARRLLNSRRPIPSEQQPTGGLSFFTPDALLLAVECGDVALLRGTHIVELHSHGGRVQRRQDMPADSFFPISELRRLVSALGADWGLLFVTLSYRWLTADHPDPDGFHLAIVAKIAGLYLGQGHGSDHMIDSPLVAAFKRAALAEPADFALLWEYAALTPQPLPAPAQPLQSRCYLD